MQLRLRSLAKGAATFLPGFSRLANSAAGTWMGARYYYSVWLRHLIRVHQSCGPIRFDVVAELGPGDALGVGLCAILSGANRYLGFDHIAFTSKPESLALLDTLTELFKARASVPDDEEFPAVYPRLREYAFPHQILTTDRLAFSLAPKRLDAIRAVLLEEGNAPEGIEIRYVAAWVG